MNVYVAEFPGVYHGGLAVVVAHDRGHARRMLDATLPAGYNNREEMIAQAAFSKVETSKPCAIILTDGDY